MAVHRFVPTHYHRTIGWHEPVLTLAEGDRLLTTTVDAGGHDHAGEQVTPRGNPQTGPFFIEGAEPGDALAVTLVHLAPNRSRGYSSAPVAANVVDPSFAHTLGPPERLFWHVDVERWTARLEVPLPGLENLELRLDPMLGCFGVAPPLQQAISTATSGEHGGNMDYRRFRKGTTVYFPVFAPGALFHVGDGHATQGDGEIVGTGIEISFDVELSFRLVKGWQNQWPRGEDATSIFAVGNARPLDQCVQHATTEMLRWLKQDYGLSLTAASTLLGQCVSYEIANVYDPAYTVACRIEKDTLARLRGT